MTATPKVDIDIGGLDQDSHTVICNDEMNLIVTILL